MKLRIHTWFDWGTGDLRMLIMQDNPSGLRDRAYTVYNLYTHESVTLEVGQKVPEAHIITIPWMIGTEIKRAFAEWVYAEGIRPEDITKKEGTLEGALQATKYHLEDLRRLLNLAAPPASGASGGPTGPPLNSTDAARKP